MRSLAIAKAALLLLLFDCGSERPSIAGQQPQAHAGNGADGGALRLSTPAPVGAVHPLAWAAAAADSTT